MKAAAHIRSKGKQRQSDEDIIAAFAGDVVEIGVFTLDAGDDVIFGFHCVGSFRYTMTSRDAAGGHG